MNTSPELLTQSLKHAGLRITPQREAICRFLSETQAHPTAALIYEHVRQQYPSLSLMTVYNTLNTLVELGVVNALGHAGDDHIHYDADTTPHINLACVSCHQIADIDSAFAVELAREIDASGYILLGARVLYYGLCPTCQKKRMESKID